ncbi:MAG: transporter substrate-binding domain-containing protein [Betaproteobacteria bacterium]|nr:transporter substrate-binding domain-containing protein [Betaproteobacteria bacterium]MDE2124925.1 transporter substrate-binding domain-containing protein [Betaproteobacteria bacterium]MDE2186666.1 transporter substrate-binding domain-containing protein [Betaproteobacteria bacterium]MDE2323546.1 transporter substrate-binding domain-containing protein [Betaproteobacteria bacterium]
MSLRLFKFLPMLFATLLCTLAAPAQADALAHIMQTKVLKVAIPTDFPPYGFVGTTMQPEGLDVDMAKYVAKEMGVKIDLVPASSSNRIPYLQTGKVDLVISTLGKTAEREKVVDFSHAYSPFFLAVYGPKTMTIKSPADLAGKSISVTRGSVEDIQLTKVAPPSTNIMRFEDNASTIAAFVSGQSQLVATGVSVASNMMTHNPGLGAQMKFVLKDSPNFVGVPKGDKALLDKVNAIIDAAKKNGELNKLSEHWLGRPVGELPE